eukprot:Skav209679  [mRNA]  locus=scaffold1603:85710:98860:- [translate_table: standard]
MAAPAKPPEEIPDAQKNDVAKLTKGLSVLLTSKQIPWIVQGELARQGYVTVEDLGDRWDSPEQARTNGPRDLSFTDGTNGFTAQTSQFTAMRLLQAVRTARVAASGDDDSVLQAAIFLAKQSGVSAADIQEAEDSFNQRLKDIYVSEMGLGTQSLLAARWGSADFNAPDEALCHQLMDRAILEGGVNLVDTAEQYPIPSDGLRPEGATEEIIGKWVAKDKTRRDKIVVATKITGGLNVNAQNIREDLEGSLKSGLSECFDGRGDVTRMHKNAFHGLGARPDLYLTHWSFRMSQPQQNWGQSLQYRQTLERIARREGQATFEEVVGAMDKLVKQGKIRGWGCCNESPYGATRLVATAKAMGATAPCVFQNDFSILNRRCEAERHPASGDSLDIGKGPTLYRYRSAAATEATKSYAELAKKAGLSLTELSLRPQQCRKTWAAVVIPMATQPTWLVRDMELY